jgi:hypothetical protein
LVRVRELRRAAAVHVAIGANARHLLALLAALSACNAELSPQEAVRLPGARATLDGPPPVAQRPGDEGFVVGAGTLPEGGASLSECNTPRCAVDPKVAYLERMREARARSRERRVGLGPLLVRLGDFLVEGPLDRADAVRKLIEARPIFLPCHPPELDPSPTLMYGMNLRLTIEPSGQVSNVETVSLGRRRDVDREVVRCVERACFLLDFPKGEKASTVRFDVSMR